MRDRYLETVPMAPRPARPGIIVSIGPHEQTLQKLLFDTLSRFITMLDIIMMSSHRSLTAVAAGCNHPRKKQIYITKFRFTATQRKPSGSPR